MRLDRLAAARPDVGGHEPRRASSIAPGSRIENRVVFVASLLQHPARVFLASRPENPRQQTRVGNDLLQTPVGCRA